MNTMAVSLPDTIARILTRLAGYLEVADDELGEFVAPIVMDGLVIAVGASNLEILGEYYPSSRGSCLMLGAFQERRYRTGHFFAWRVDGPITRIWRPLYAYGLSTPEEGVYWTDHVERARGRALDHINANLPEGERALAQKCLHV